MTARVTDPKKPSPVSKGRAAGDSPYYRFVLLRRNEFGGYEPDFKVTIELPSVTTITGKLEKPLVPWAYQTTLRGIASLAAEGELSDEMSVETLGRLLEARKLRPYDVRDTAAGKGSEAHHYLERLTWGHKPTDEDREDPFKRALVDWWNEYDQRLVLASEKPVFSLHHGFAGTVDLVTSEKVTDLKTRKATDSRGRPTTPYESEYLQVAAYRLALREMDGQAPQGTSILIVRDDGTWEEFDSSDPDGDERAFLSLVPVYRWLEIRKEDWKNSKGGNAASKQET